MKVNLNRRQEASARVIISKTIKGNDRKEAQKAADVMLAFINSPQNAYDKNVLIKIKPKMEEKLMPYVSIQTGLTHNLPFLVPTDKIEVSVRKKGFLSKIKSYFDESLPTAVANKNFAYDINKAGIACYEKLLKIKDFMPSFLPQKRA